MYACRGVVDFFLRPSNKGPRGMSDMGYPIYPPSIYRCAPVGLSACFPGVGECSCMFHTQQTAPLAADMHASQQTGPCIVMCAGSSLCNTC